ncbi:MAG: DUF2807 domain-containing protein [Chitinophagaceae bacterium]|nr:DUF2807 domain-containing protein [Chitinophagaceae bacterium]
MKKQFLFLCMMLSVALAMSQEKVVVNDKYAQQRSVGGFSEISVSGGIDLYLSPDDKEVVVVSASEPKYRDRIVTRVNGNRLEIYFDNKGMTRWPDRMNLKAYVSFRTLQKLKASGASDVYVNGVIKSPSLEIYMSGASDFNGAILVDELKIDQSGSSDSRISGKAERVTIDVSGASDVKAYELTVNYCNVEASGASDIQITVNKELSARASGSSDVQYRGEGLIRDIKTSGASSVSRKGK